MKKTVAFYQPFMNERGTCVAMYDYAHFNQTLLGNKSVFLYDSFDSRNDHNGLMRIKGAFDTFDIHCADYTQNNTEEIRVSKIDEILRKTNADYIYICKSGYNDKIISKVSKTLVHVVGMVSPSEKHGDVWAYVSEFSSKACSGGTLPYVPYMVNLPNTKDNLRKELNIPDNAIVFGRYGGQDTFDNWANDIIRSVVNKRPNVYFLFMNTPKGIDHPNVKYIKPTVELYEKVRFINTCDAMLHVRWVGETFGAACAEFSSLNKPIITDSRSPERNHIDILGDRGIYFDSPNKLFNILFTFIPNYSIDWNCYKEYTPDKVMTKFERVFLV